MASTARRLFAVGVCYYLQPADLKRRLQAALQSAGVRATGIIVCNSPDSTWSALGTNELDFLAGSNRHLDFSGYFEGLEQLLALHPDAAHSNILFLNDSTFTKHAGPTLIRQVVAHDAMVRQLQVATICGVRHPYRSVNMKNPWSGDVGYISSFCFLLNALALPMLRVLPKEALDMAVDGPAALEDSAWGAALPTVFREQIRAHLLYPGSAERWKGAGNMTAELLAKKARCVFFEHRLSGAIATAGATVPVNAGRKSSLKLLAAEAVAALRRRFRI